MRWRKLLSRRGTVRFPAALVILHFLLMMWVGYVWKYHIAEDGTPVGEWNRAYDAVRTVDSLAYWVSERIIVWILNMPSPGPVDTFVWLVGLETISDVTLHLFWPFLLILGSIQWALIGFCIPPLWRFAYRRLVGN